jgi:hypothetical protein
MERLELRLPQRLVDRFHGHSKTAERTVSDAGRDALSLYLSIVSLLERRGEPIVIEINPSLSYFTVLHDQADKDKPEYTPLFPFLKPIS